MLITSSFTRSFGLAAAAAGLLIGAGSAKAANLVLNGDFENSSGFDNGIGQIDTTTSGMSVTLPSWVKTCINNCTVATGQADPAPSSEGFAFIVNDQADYRPNSTTGGFRNGIWPKNVGGERMWFWGPQNGTPVNNGFTIGSRGKVLAIDGDYGRAKLSQTLSGLDTTKTYTLSFEYAGAQQYGYRGATSQWWSVQAGSNSWTTPTMSVADQGFNGWNTFTQTFTPTTASIELAFTAFGTALNGGSGAELPPFLLLDNVQLLDSNTPPPGPNPNPPPTPSTGSVPGPLPILGAGIAFGWGRRLRERLSATTR